MQEIDQINSPSSFEITLERLSKAALRLVGVILFVVLAYVALDNLVSTSIVIQPIGCPKECVENGFTPQVNAERLRSSIVTIISEAKTVKDMPDSLLFSEVTNVVIPSTTLSVGYIIDSLRQMIGINNKYTITGEIVRVNGALSFMLRINNRNIFSKLITASDNDFSSVFHLAGIEILRQVDPYVLAAFHSANNNTALARAEAMRALNKFEGSDYYNKWLYNLIGTSFYKEGDSKLAQHFYDKTINLDRNFAIAYTNIGNIHFDTARKLGRSSEVLRSIEKYKEAIYYYRGAALLEPKSHVALSQVARSYRDIGQYDMAITTYLALIKLKPDDVSYRLAYANMLARALKSEDAHDQFARLVVHSPENATVRNDFGAALDGAGRLNDAVEQFRYAILLKPDYILALNNLGDTCLELGRDDEALEMFGRALALNDRSLRAQRGLRTIYERRGYHADELAVLERELR